MLQLTQDLVKGKITGLCKIWNTEDKFNSLIQLLNYHKGSSIVYCNTRKQTEHLAELINQSGHSADFFHGGLLAEEKKQKLAVNFYLFGFFYFYKPMKKRSALRTDGQFSINSFLTFTKRRSLQKEKSLRQKKCVLQ